MSSEGGVSAQNRQLGYGFGAHSESNELRRNFHLSWQPPENSLVGYGV